MHFKIHFIFKNTNVDSIVSPFYRVLCSEKFRSIAMISNVAIFDINSVAARKIVEMV
jgi:hypothetical protein